MRVPRQLMAHKIDRTSSASSHAAERTAIELLELTKLRF
jgi:hypothetical protein